jgi:PqqD family protein of HPr-rel-A system
MAEHALEPVLLQADREVAEQFQAGGTPSMVLVRPDGRIGSPLAQGADAIRTLVAQTRAVAVPIPPSPAETLGLPVGREPGAGQPTPVPADARPRPHPAVEATPMDDDVVIYDPRSGQGHVLNATAAHVWGLLDGERTTHALAEAVAVRYAVPVAQAVDDVRELVRDLHQAGLILA